MPTKPKTFCSKCRKLNCSCGKRAARQRDQQRPNATDRGYDSTWKRFRKSYLRANPLCVDCERENRLTPAKEVHHIIKIADDPSKRLEASNCMALCKSHHSVRTARGE